MPALDWISQVIGEVNQVSVLPIRRARRVGSPDTIDAAIRVPAELPPLTSIRYQPLQAGQSRSQLLVSPGKGLIGEIRR